MKLFKIELLKILRRKRTIGIFVLCILAALYFLYISSADQGDVTAFKQVNYESLVAQTEENITTLTAELDVYKDDEKVRKNILKIVDAYNENLETYQLMLEALSTNNWRLELSAIIAESETQLRDIRAGILQGASLKEIQAGLDMAQYLLNNDIEPLLYNYQVNSFNTTYHFIKDLYIILIPFFTLLLSFSFTEESKMNTLKFLVQQPCKRWKITLSKLFAAITVNTCVLLVSLAAVGIGAFLIGGTGSGNYPVSANNVLSTFEIGYAPYTTVAIFLENAVPLLLANLLLFTSLGVFFSMLVKSNIAAYFISILVTSLLYVVRPIDSPLQPLHASEVGIWLFNHVFAVLTYIHTSTEGIILTLFLPLTLLLVLASILIFNRKNLYI